MNKILGHVRPGWGGRLMCLAIKAVGLLLQRTICSHCGGPAGLHWHPAKTSGSQGIWWENVFLRIEIHPVQIRAYALACEHGRSFDAQTHTHIC